MRNLFRKSISFILATVLMVTGLCMTPVQAATKKAQNPTIKTVTKTVNQGYKKSWAPISVKKAHGTVTYTLKNCTSKFTLNTKTGKLKVNKTTKPGTYNVKIKVTCKGDAKYKSYSKTVTTKVKVNEKDKGSFWNGKVDTSWYTGNKKSYSIKTAAQLAGLAEIVNRKGDEFRLEGVTINLKNDIVLNDTTDWSTWSSEKPADHTWTPIGEIGSAIMGYRPFAGVFNGNGHTIRGMFVNGCENGGLFNYLSHAVVKDLNFEKCVILTNEQYGQASAGTLAGISENSYIDNCKVKYTRILGSGDVGGLVGSAARRNYLVEMTTAFLLGCGIVINPLIYRAVEAEHPETLSGTFISGCSVNNANLKTYREWGSNPVGGLVGNFETDGAIVSSKSKNIKALSIDLIDYSRSIPLHVDPDAVKSEEKNGSIVHKGACGAIFGTIAENVIVKKCSFDGFTRLDNTKSRSDSSVVKK